MKTTARHAMLSIWVLGGTAALAHLWLVRPDLSPRIPPGLALWLVELYGSTNGEELRDLETLLALGSAFAVVLILTFSGLFIFQRYMHRAVP